jgi:hypothetical protein
VLRAPVNSSSTKLAESLSAAIDRWRVAPSKEAETAVSETRHDFVQDDTEVEVVDAKERWSEYRLADGTTMRIKSVVIAVFRENGQQTENGEPVYNMKSTLITDIRAPAVAPRSMT